MEPKIENVEGMLFVGYEETFTPSKGEFDGVEKAWERLFQLTPGYIKDEVKNDQFWGVTYNTQLPTYSFIAGGLVEKFEDVPSDLSTFETPPQLYSIFEHIGNTQNLGQTIQQSIEWIRKSEFIMNGTYNLEMYDSRCRKEEPDKYIVDIYIPVKRKV